jgi:flavin reductase (DIM6/NTAB) family NADH-FMN oxidoreductase RutF
MDMISSVSSGYREIAPDDIDDNVFRLISEDWFLLTSGDLSSGYNTMTASWGSLGQLWHRRAVFVFVRPQRYTWKFMEDNSLFSMCFFKEEYREALKYCGSHSGRMVDKAHETGLTPFEPVPGTTAFKQSKLIFVCKKLYQQDIDPERFLEEEIDSLYPEKGYHRMYIGEIQRVLSKV